MDKEATIPYQDDHSNSSTNNAPAYNLFVDAEAQSRTDATSCGPRTAAIAACGDVPSKKELAKEAKKIAQVSFCCNVFLIGSLAALLAVLVGALVLAMIYVIDNTEVGPLAFFLSFFLEPFCVVSYQE
jgi:hypothetical protein